MSFSLKQDLSNYKTLEIIINISYSCLNWQIIIHAQPSAIIQTWKFCVMVEIETEDQLKSKPFKEPFQLHIFLSDSTYSSNGERVPDGD